MFYKPSIINKRKEFSKSEIFISDSDLKNRVSNMWFLVGKDKDRALYRLMKVHPKNRMKSIKKFIKRYIRSVYKFKKLNLETINNRIINKDLKFLGKYLHFPYLKKSKKFYTSLSSYRFRLFYKGFRLDRDHALEYKIFSRSRYWRYKRNLKLKRSFRKRSFIKRLSNLFFFWFLLLYKDLYKFLMKIIWNLWFKFLYLSNIYINYTHLFNIISNFHLISFNNFFLSFNFLYFPTRYNNFNLFLDQLLNFAFGSLGHLLLSNRLFYNLEYISFSFNRFVNLYIQKQIWSKRNVKLKRFFRFKV